MYSVLRWTFPVSHPIAFTKFYIFEKNNVIWRTTTTTTSATTHKTPCEIHLFEWLDMRRGRTLFRFSVTSTNLTTLLIYFPVTLQNEGVNVCFLNSIVQVLYSLIEFRTYVEQTNSTRNMVSKLKNLLEEMERTNDTSYTSACRTLFRFSVTSTNLTPLLI